jgi:transcription initiation factor TFIID subunit 15
VLIVRQGTGDRLEQARKVQQLLAALKQPQNGTAQPTQPGPPLLGPPPPSNVGMPPPNPNQYYAPPPIQQSAAPYPPPPGPSANPYGQMPSQTSTPQPGQIHTGMPGLPPNILALLQQSQGQQGQGTAPQQMPPHYGMPPPPPQSMMSPPPMSSMPPGAPQPGTQNYQQLMAILVSPYTSFSMRILTTLMSRLPRKGPNLANDNSFFEALLVCSCALRYHFSASFISFSCRFPFLHLSL